MVSLLSCKDYTLEKLREVLTQSFDNLGGVKKHIKPGQKVLLKPNLLMKKTPEKATTTHPLFVAALAQIIIEAGAIVTIADSPGGFYSENVLKGLYSTCGMTQAAEISGATLNYDTSFEEVSYKEGRVSKVFSVIKPVLEADVVISVAKLKTHGLTTYTGAVKNLFGVVPGKNKAEYHLRFQDIDVFCGALVDLCEYVSPVLSFIDGIVGMEGEGPSGGTPREIGAVIASESPHEADIVASRLIGLKIDNVPTLKIAAANGICSRDVEVVGDEIQPIKDYKMPPNRLSDLSGGRTMKLLGKMFSPKPVFDKKLCVKCGECVRCCPAKAIELTPFPKVDMKKCIRCFCCQELCPKIAVKIKRMKILEG